MAELKQLVSKRDFEIGRLREQRDQHQAEINERKAKEQIRSASALEFRALAEARAVCTSTIRATFGAELLDRNG